MRVVFVYDNIDGFREFMETQTPESLFAYLMKAPSSRCERNVDWSNPGGDARLKKILTSPHTITFKTTPRIGKMVIEFNVEPKVKETAFTEIARRVFAMPIDTSHIKEGGFHEWLGKSKDEPITNADVQKGLNSDDAHVRKMANFARNSRKWKHK